MRMKMKTNKDLFDGRETTHKKLYPFEIFEAILG